MKNICTNPSFLLATEHPLERQARQALVGLIAFFICAYLYCVGASILNVMARTEAESHAVATRDTIAELESSYFSLSQAMTPDVGRTLGLVPVAASSYVAVPGATAMR
jgi:hypothetical protein